MNYKQIYAIKKANEERILKVCPNCPNTSGIYFLLREEDGFKYAYIGQSVNILQRLADHLQGYQYIDLSIKKHGFYSKENPTGYRVHCLPMPKEMLDEQEQKYIKQYANAGYQMRNATSGSQGVGKKGLDNQKQPRTYYEGLNNGYERARKEIAHLFNLHLDYKTNRISRTKTNRKHCKNSRIFWMVIQMDNRYAVYERIKTEIARTAKTHEEYEKRIKALAKKLKI